MFEQVIECGFLLCAFSPAHPGQRNLRFSAGARGGGRVESGFSSNRTSLQTLTNTLLIMVKWQVSGAVNRPHQRGPEIKSSHYSKHSHLYDPANNTRLTQLFAISKCVIHYKKISYPDIICYCSQGEKATQRAFLSVIVESRALCLRHFHIAAVKV